MTTPAHLLVDDFITAAIYEKRILLVDPGLKEAIIGLIRKNFANYGWELHQWDLVTNQEKSPIP